MSKSSFIKDPSEFYRNMRPDLSPYLFHFSNYEHPFLDWLSILNEESIRSKKNDFICYSEAPITMMGRMLDYFEEKHGRFSKYGIGILRNELIKLGAKPVIYGDSEDETALSGTQMSWRYVNLTYTPIEKIGDKNNSIDYTWQREWRTRGNKLDFSVIPDSAIIVIAPSIDQLRNDAKLAKHQCPIIKLPSRNYKITTFDWIKTKDNDYDLRLDILLQYLKS